jgi:hypothetical protein
MTSRCCLATGEYAAAACWRVNPWARAGEAPSSQNGRAAGAAGGPIHLALGESSVRIGPLGQPQCPSTQIQPPVGCCVHRPGIQVVFPDGGGTY